MITKNFSIFLPLTLLCVFAACSPTRSDEKITVAVSIPPQETLLRQIAGDSVDIVTLLDAGTNPETFEPSVSNMSRISSADAYMMINHLPFESALTQRIKESSPDLRFFDSSKGIELIYGTHDDHGCNHQHEHAVPSVADDESHAEGLPDPHVWTSITNLKIMAANMLGVLDSIDSRNISFYKANYNQLIQHLDSLDNVIKSQLQSADNPAFLIWHPSLSYFARDYKLQQIALGQENKELTPVRLQARHEQAVNSGAVVIFLQQNFDQNQADNLARQLNLPIVSINPLDADYESLFLTVTNALTLNNGY